MTNLTKACLFEDHPSPHGPVSLDGTSKALIGKLVKVRELEGQAIGTEVWPSSRVMLSWLTSSPNAPVLKGTTILELGSGCGALAMGLVNYAGVSRVFASEGDPDVYDNLCDNIVFNQMCSSVVPCIWDWEDSLTPPPEVDLDKVDLFIASDVVYLGTGECRLSHALAGLCRPGIKGANVKKAWLLLADRPQGGEQFLPSPLLDEGIDSACGPDGQLLSAVGRFLSACSRRGLCVTKLAIELALVETAIHDSKCVGGRREFEGLLGLYCIQHV